MNISRISVNQNNNKTDKLNFGTIYKIQMNKKFLNHPYFSEFSNPCYLLEGILKKTKALTYENERQKFEESIKNEKGFVKGFKSYFWQRTIGSKLDYLFHSETNKNDIFQSICESSKVQPWWVAMHYKVEEPKTISDNFYNGFVYTDKDKIELQEKIMKETKGISEKFYKELHKLNNKEKPIREIIDEDGYVLEDNFAYVDVDELTRRDLYNSRDLLVAEKVEQVHQELLSKNQVEVINIDDITDLRKIYSIFEKAITKD